MDQTSEPSARQRNWGRLGLIAAGAVVVGLVLVVIIRLIVSAPHPALGETDARALQLGSCLREEGDLERYTVVDCSTSHPQQVFGIVDFITDSDVYTEFSAMNAYADQVCGRYLEYGLFVKSEIEKDLYEAVAIAVPSEKQFDSGTTDARCTLTARDGSGLTTDLYQAMP